MIETRIRSLIAGGESRLVELKSQWYDFSPAGKATFVKDVLALANSAARGEEANLIIGVEDPNVGGSVIGVATPPTSETVVQILADYTSPPPTADLRLTNLDDKPISVLRIEGSANRPHHAVRQFNGILEPSLVYIRRDRTNGTATSREVEGMLLERIGRRGVEIDETPLRAGFVGHGSGGDSHSLIVRVTNVVDRPVAGVDVLIDLEHIGMPEIKARERLLTNVLLNSGESREAELSLSRPIFYHRYFDVGKPGQLNITEIRNYGLHVGDRWLTAHLRVYYRDDEGFLGEITRVLALDGY